MKLSQPRIPPLAESEWSAEQRKVLAPIKASQPFYNVLGTLSRHWDAAQKFTVWAYHVMGETSRIAPREREILILRVGWLCQAEYEWGQHVIFAREAGLTDVEIARIKAGPDAPGWTPFEAALLRATDELHRDSCIGDATWKTLAERYDDLQMMDVVFAVGQYHLVSMALNSFGVQLDAGVKGF
ncbi:MAG: carboxymuconolactone decarboxylase family protein [Porticoccaceae bacterium]|nr:MAG: carboxymuconolactone decarboxylase family protein [Porticoccaceae bacterium]